METIPQRRAGQRVHPGLGKSRRQVARIRNHAHREFAGGSSEEDISHPLGGRNRRDIYACTAWSGFCPLYDCASQTGKVILGCDNPQLRREVMSINAVSAARVAILADRKSTRLNSSHL